MADEPSDLDTRTWSPVLVNSVDTLMTDGPLKWDDLFGLTERAPRLKSLQNPRVIAASSLSDLALEPSAYANYLSDVARGLPGFTPEHLGNAVTLPQFQKSAAEVAMILRNRAFGLKNFSGTLVWTGAGDGMPPPLLDVFNPMALRELQTKDGPAMRFSFNSDADLAGWLRQAIEAGAPIKVRPVSQGAIEYAARPPVLTGLVFGFSGPFKLGSNASPSVVFTVHSHRTGLSLSVTKINVHSPQGWGQGHTTPVSDYLESGFMYRFRGSQLDQNNKTRFYEDNTPYPCNSRQRSASVMF